MKIFESNGKINFVDKNNVFVGFDYSSNCCEHFGYYIGTEIPKTDIELFDLANFMQYDVDYTDYIFDTSFYDAINIPDSDTGTAIFKLVPESNHNKKILYLVLFNSHNGYYSHGFECKVNEEMLYEGYL